MTRGDGGANAKLKGTVREDVRMLDQVKLSHTVTKQIFTPFLVLNGIAGRCKASWGGLSAEEVAATGALLVQASQSGLEPTDDAIETLSERFGFGVQRAAQAQSSPGGDPDQPGFDPNKDIVAQRYLWRNSLKEKPQLSGGAPEGAGAAQLSADDEDGHWVTVDGAHLFIKDSPDGGKNDKLPADEKSDEIKSDKIRSGRAVGPIASASHYTGRGSEASPGHDSTASERRTRISDEERRLRDWAAANGKLKGKLPREDARGSEPINFSAFAFGPGAIRHPLKAGGKILPHLPGHQAELPSGLVASPMPLVKQKLVDEFGWPAFGRGQLVFLCHFSFLVGTTRCGVRSAQRADPTFGMVVRRPRRLCAGATPPAPAVPPPPSPSFRPPLRLPIVW
jgi:hypothetical protein